MAVVKCKVPARSCSTCEAEENGRIRNMAFVEKGETQSLSINDPVLFQDELLALELAGKAYIIRDVNGTYDGGAATTGKGRGSEPERMTGKRHSITVTDFQAVNNVGFWNDIRSVNLVYDFLFWTETKVWPVIGRNIMVDPKIPITDDSESQIESEINIQWSDLDLPLNYTVNQDKMSLCPALEFVQLVSNGVESINGTEITIIDGGNLDVDIEFNPVATEYSVKEGSTLPAWVTLDASTGNLSGTAVLGQGGTFTIVGKTEWGIAGEVEITIIVT